MPSPTTRPPASSTRPDATSNSRWFVDRCFWIVLGLLVASLALFEITPLDTLLQDHFYDPVQRTWMVDARAPVPRAIFYHGPKVVIILIAVAMIALLLGPRRWRQRIALDRRRLGAALLVLAAVPAFIGFLKARSNVFCPGELERYGGLQPYVRVFDSYPDDNPPTRRGRCWPAGHASGGFALMGLSLLATSHSRRRAGVALGLIVGWTMGIYQMLKGAHFLSHTVITMLIAGLFLCAIARVFRLNGSPSSAVRAP